MYSEVRALGLTDRALEFLIVREEFFHGRIHIRPSLFDMFTFESNMLVNMARME